MEAQASIRLVGRKSRRIQRYSLLSKTQRIVAVFGLAGLLSAWAFVSYSAWVESLYRAVPSQYASPGGSGVDLAAAYNNWYRANTALTPFADRKWPILCLGFPIAMTLASIVAKKTGWLGHLEIGQLLLGVIPVYFAPALVFYLSGVSWFALLIPSLALAAYLLALSLKMITSKWPTKLFLGFLISGAACVACWFLIINPQYKSTEDTAWNVFFISIEMIWGGIFGLGLAVPQGVRPPPRSPILESPVTRN